MRSLGLLFLLPTLLPAQAWREYYAEGIRAANDKDYGRAEAVLTRAVAEAEKAGPNDLGVATTLNTLGLAYQLEGKIEASETAFQRALTVLAKSQENDTADAAAVHYNLANSYYLGKKYGDAVEIYVKYLPLFQRWFGGDGQRTGEALNNLGDSYRIAGDFVAAEKYLNLAALARESRLGIDSSELGETMDNFGLLYTAEGKFRQAEFAFKLAVTIEEVAAGPHDEAMRRSFQDYAAFLQKDNRGADAAEFLGRAQAIHTGR